jgi:hypothetical protein
MPPLNGRSARRRDRYLNNKQQTQEMNIHAVSGIQTRDAKNQAAADPRLRSHGHWVPLACCPHVFSATSGMLSPFLTCLIQLTGTKVQLTDK